MKDNRKFFRTIAIILSSVVFLVSPVVYGMEAQETNTSSGIGFKNTALYTAVVLSWLASEVAVSSGAEPFSSDMPSENSNLADFAYSLFTTPAGAVVGAATCIASAWAGLRWVCKAVRDQRADKIKKKAKKEREAEEGKREWRKEERRERRERRRKAREIKAYGECDPMPDDGEKFHEIRENTHPEISQGGALEKKQKIKKRPKHRARKRQLKKQEQEETSDERKRDYLTEAQKEKLRDNAVCQALFPRNPKERRPPFKPIQLIKVLEILEFTELRKSSGSSHVVFTMTDPLSSLISIPTNVKHSKRHQIQEIKDILIKLGVTREMIND